MEAFCKTCDSNQEVEPVEGSEVPSTVFCTSCGEEFILTIGSKGSNDAYDNFKIGKVLKVEAIPKQKDLKKILVDITGSGEEDSAVQIVTNAKYIEPNWLVVVALEGAIVPAGAVLDDDPEAFQVKPVAVGGVKSNGMVCDSPTLAWVGGAKGQVQQLSEAEFRIGDKPPATRPRN